MVEINPSGQKMHRCICLHEKSMRYSVGLHEEAVKVETKRLKMKDVKDVRCLDIDGC